MSKTPVKSSRVVSNLLQQNCYIRDITRLVDLKTDNSVDKTYYSLDEIVDSDGVKIVKNPVPYHITPDFVASFADSADYRRDPANAIANGVKSKNLGDCVDFQKLMNMDSASLASLYSQLQAKFNTKSVVTSDKVVDNNNNNNGGDNNG